MTKFQFKKKYGQNFLQDEAIISKIASTINPSSRDLIIEIGPGAGALTKKLKDHNCQLIAFEIDEDTKKYLLPLKNEHTEIFYGDFLTIDLQKFLQNRTYDKLYFVGNLPYYITTPIIEKIIDSHIPHESLTIMVQKEVADRFTSTPQHKEYGLMTVLLHYWYDTIKVIDVPRNAFYPSPKVDSTVLKLIKKEPLPVDYKNLKAILKASFQFKRKTILNNLKEYDRLTLEKVLNEHGYTLSNRPEDLDLQTYVDLANRLTKSD